MSEKETVTEEKSEKEELQGDEEKEEDTSKDKKTKKKTKKSPKEEGIIDKGDFILVEITGKAVETGEIFDTTDEELAKEENIFEENRSYGPRLVIVGEGFVLKGLDERLSGLKLEESAEVEIPPEDAFGERSPDNVRILPFRILRSKGVNPVVGQQVEIDGRNAVVRSIGAGRVQLDYNHPLAGRNLEYEIKAIKKYESDLEKIRALVGRRFLGIDLDLFKIRKLKTKVKIEIPEEIFFGENIQIAKRGVAIDIHRYFEDVGEVEYVEVIKRS